MFLVVEFEITMKLQPSKIHFSQELLFHYSAKISINNLCPIKSSKSCNAITTSSLNNNLPKLQVFKKGDCYFALDNNCLTLYRRLELTGHLGDRRTVDVDVVATKKIPKNVYDTSECSSADNSSISETDSSDEGNPFVQ